MCILSRKSSSKYKNFIGAILSGLQHVGFSKLTNPKALDLMLLMWKARDAQLPLHTLTFNNLGERMKFQRSFANDTLRGCRQHSVPHLSTSSSSFGRLSASLRSLLIGFFFFKTTAKKASRPLTVSKWLDTFDSWWQMVLVVAIVTLRLHFAWKCNHSSKTLFSSTTCQPVLFTYIEWKISPCWDFVSRPGVWKYLYMSTEWPLKPSFPAHLFAFEMLNHRFADSISKLTFLAIGLKT